MKTPRAKLEAVLNSAAQEAITEYERTGGVPSTEFAHPLDTQPPSMALRNALRVLEGACEQLCTTLSPHDPTFIWFPIQAKVADVLFGHPGGPPVADIAKKPESIHTSSQENLQGS
jgi:hypothetical protein